MRFAASLAGHCCNHQQIFNQQWPQVDHYKTKISQADEIPFLNKFSSRARRFSMPAQQQAADVSCHLFLMRSNLKIIGLLFSLGTIAAAFQIGSCNVRQTPDKKNDFRTKELVDKYTKGKDIFNNHCNTCHLAPDKKATDQQLFDNLFKRQTSDYVIKYIGDSKKLKLSGDRFALTLDTVFNSTFEHSYKDSLSNIDFDNLIVYLKVATR